MSNKRYTIEWLDHTGKKQTLAGIDAHKLEIVKAGLNDAASFGKIQFHTIIVTMDK